jgi:DNA-binding transcriptional LysR family regulator
MEDVHQLRVFMAVAENLSFTRAAQTLFLTQSAVSHQVADLEQKLASPLFVRHGRTISLTPAGLVLVEQCRRVFGALHEAEVAVRQAARQDLGRLRVGASSTACQYIIPESLREFRECFPGHTLSIMPGDTPLVTERLLDGSIDLGLIIRPDRKVKLTYHELMTDELGFLVSPLHPWARTGKVDRRQLADQRMVLYSRNSETFRMVEKYFIRSGAPLRDWTELGSMEAIKELVKLGLGVSIIAKWIALPEISQRSLVWLPLPGMKLRRVWCIAAAGGRELTIAEQTFIGLCQTVARGLSEAA